MYLQLLVYNNNRKFEYNEMKSRYNNTATQKKVAKNE